MATTIGGMPNQPKTKHMAFRISAELQQAAREANATRKANGHDESLTDVVRKALESYVRAAKRDEKQ